MVDPPSLQDRPNDTNYNTIYDPNYVIGATAPITPSTAPEKRKRKQKAINAPFPTPEGWEELRPTLTAWINSKAPSATDAAIARWLSDKIEEMESSVLAKPGKYAYSDWGAAFKNWYRKDLGGIAGAGKGDAEDKLHTTAVLIAQKARLQQLGDLYRRLEAKGSKVLGVLHVMGGVTSIQDQLINAPAPVIDRWVESFKKVYRTQEQGGQS